MDPFKMRKYRIYLLKPLLGMLLSICLSLPAANCEEVNDAVIRQYRKALEINPADIDARYLLGVSLLRVKSYREALSHLTEVYPSRAGEMEMNYNIGLAYAGAGELQKAFEAYRKVDEINPIEARDRFRLDIAFYNLGVAYQKEENFEDAINAYGEAIQVNPEEGNAYCAKGEVMYHMRNHDAALDSLIVCKEKKPEWKGIKYYMSGIYQAKGIDSINQKNYIEARVSLNNAVSIDPENGTARYYIAYMDFTDGDYDKALENLRAIKPGGRDDLKKAVVGMYYNIGAAMQKGEDWHGSVGAYAQALEIDGNDPDLHFYLGYGYMKVGDYEASFNEFKEALRLEPRHQRAAVNLAIVAERAIWHHQKKGEESLENHLFHEALHSFNFILSYDPVNQKALEGKKVAEAGVEKINKEAAEKRERDIAARLHEGGLLISEGRYLQARKNFEAVIALDPENMKAKDRIRDVSALIENIKAVHLVAGKKAIDDGRYFDAVSEFGFFLEFEPENRDVMEMLNEANTRLSKQTGPLIADARRFEDEGRYSQAAAGYDRVLEIQRDNKAAVEGKARVMESLEKAFNEALSRGRESVKAGELVKAADHLEKALYFKPDNTVVLEELKSISGRLKKMIDDRLSEASAAVKGGRYSEAVSNYKAVLIIDRNNIQAAEGLINAEKIRDDAIAGKMSAGLKAYRDGNYHQSLSIFGEVLQISSSNDEALRMQKEARARIEELISPWLKAGAEAYRKGDIDSAIVAFKKVLNTDPANREAREYMGKMDAEKAKAAVEKEIEKYYLRGIELYTEGKYREALSEWRKVLELEPKHEKAILNIEKAKRKMEGVMETR